jgi:hypothetical protein
MNNPISEDEAEQPSRTPEEVQLGMFISSVGLLGPIGGIIAVAKPLLIFFPNVGPLIVVLAGLVPGAVTLSVLRWWGMNAKDKVGLLPRWLALPFAIAAICTAISLIGQTQNPYIHYYLHHFDPLETLLLSVSFFAMMAILLFWFVRDVKRP